MKNFIFTALSLLTVTSLVSSCNKSTDDDITNQDKGQPATMTVTFNNPGTKATGTPTNESTITSGTIMVFRSGSGILDGKASFTSVTDPISVPITAGIRDVYVIANATGSNFTTIRDITDIHNVANKYAYSSISAVGTSLPMSGMAINQNCNAATTTAPVAISVTLNYLQSKVTIQWDLTQLLISMADFEVVDAYILNVPDQSDYFATGTDNLTTYTSGYLYGRSQITGFSGGFIPRSPAYTNNSNPNLRLTDVATNSGSGANYFYIHENNRLPSPTIVVIEGEIPDPTSGIKSTYYYPIVINGLQNTIGGNSSSTVTRGQHYTVKAIIKGLGNTDPYEAISNGSVAVTITPASWTPVLIEQTFQ